MNDRHTKKHGARKNNANVGDNVDAVVLAILSNSPFDEESSDEESENEGEGFDPKLSTSVWDEDSDDDDDDETVVEKKLEYETFCFCTDGVEHDDDYVDIGPFPDGSIVDDDDVIADPILAKREMNRAQAELENVVYDVVNGMRKSKAKEPFRSLFFEDNDDHTVQASN